VATGLIGPMIGDLRTLPIGILSHASLVRDPPSRNLVVDPLGSPELSGPPELCSDVSSKAI
jgi:hypothetical protein